MRARYQIHVDGVPQAPIFDRLDDAKSEGRICAQGGDSVHIEIFPPATLPPTPMSALRFDSEIQDWVATSLPLRTR